MDKCFVACGCDDNEGITKSDLDRFTDKIENILNDERGRKLFRNFMFTSKMPDGRRTLNFWEHTERLLTYQDDAESNTYRRYLRDIHSLINEADRVEEIDFATMERLNEARESGDKEAIVEALRSVKVEATKALRREYTAFRKHFIATTK